MPNHRCIPSIQLAFLLGAWIYGISSTSALSKHGTYTSTSSWNRNYNSRTTHYNRIHPHKQFALSSSNHPSPISTLSPTRYSSRDAASLLEHNSIKDDSLLLLTCDGSGRGGGSKHEGLAAVLRILHGVNKLPPGYNVTNEDASITTSSNHVDLIHTIYKRRTPSQKYSNEVAAISLGIKRVLEGVPLSCRKRVLILSDSESALRFYCGDGSTTSLSNHLQGGQSHRRLLQRLVDESLNGVFFTKIRSSSRGIEMKNSTTRNDTCTNNWDGTGFIDHDAADYLSSATRSIPNSQLEMNEESELDQIPFRAVCSLRQQDIEWLKNSDEGVEPAHNGKRRYWNKIRVRGSDAREEQKRRNESKVRLIREMLGIEGL